MQENGGGVFSTKEQYLRKKEHCEMKNSPLL